MASSDSTLPGVSLTFRAPAACQFSLAQAQAGIAIPYDVVVAQDVAGVVPTQQDAGHCETPGPSGLIVSGSITGGGQTYCLCDIGFCAPAALPAVTLHAGTYPGTFSWQGRNWGGPSDTNNPMGAPFPSGKLSTPGRRDGDAQRRQFSGQRRTVDHPHAVAFRIDPGARICPGATLDRWCTGGI